MRMGVVLGGTLLAACCTQAPPVGAEPAARTPSVVITAGGIAGFEGDVPFTLPAIERAFAGMEVVAAPNADVPAFLVRPPEEATALFVVRPDWTRGYVGSIAAIVPGASENIEFQVGVSSTNRPQTIPELACTVPSGARDGALICEASRVAGVLRLSFRASRGDPVLDQIAYAPPL